MVTMVTLVVWRTTALAALENKDAIHQPIIVIHPVKSISYLFGAMTLGPITSLVIILWVVFAALGL